MIVDEFQIITQEELGREIFDNLYRTVRKQGGIMTCLTQTLSDNLLQAEMQAMLSNSEFIVLLNQSGIDRNILKQIYPEISEEEIRYVTNAKVGSGLIKCGDKVVPLTVNCPRTTCSMPCIIQIFMSKSYISRKKGNRNETEHHRKHAGKRVQKEPGDRGDEAEPSGC